MFPQVSLFPKSSLLYNLVFIPWKSSFMINWGNYFKLEWMMRSLACVVIFLFHFQRLRFIWYEEEASIFCWAHVTPVKKESPCLYHVHYGFGSITCMRCCLSTLDDRYFSSCGIQLYHKFALLQARQVSAHSFRLFANFIGRRFCWFAYQAHGDFMVISKMMTHFEIKDTI